RRGLSTPSCGLLVRDPRAVQPPETGESLEAPANSPPRDSWHWLRPCHDLPGSVSAAPDGVAGSCRGIGAESETDASGGPADRPDADPPAVNVPSFMSDRNGTITWLNDAAIKVLGDLVGRSLTAFVAPESVPIVRRQLERKLRGHVRVTDYVIDVRTVNGRTHRAEVSSVRIEDDNDCHAVFGVVVVGPPREGAA